MKGGSAIVRVAWILLGLLAIGSAAFELGRPKTTEEPFATSFDPSGAAAFAELLRQDGYQVQIDALVPASIPADQLAIAFVKRGEISLPLEAVSDQPPASSSTKKRNDESPSQSDAESPDAESDVAPAIIQMLVGHLRRGGMGMILGYNPELDLKVEHPVPITVSDPAMHSYGIVLPQGVGTYSGDLVDADASLPAWLTAGQSFANLNQIGTGRAVILRSGEVAMNTYIDQGDNAKFLLDQVHLLAPSGATIRIIDGSIIGAGGGLMEALGPWAQGVRLQVILVGIVIVYALGKRFGLADETLPMQRGARDLLDGIADTYGRGRAAKAGLSAVLEDADRAVRRQLKLPADAPLRKRNELLPQSAAHALTACEHGLMQELSSEQALALARNLETELELFLKHRRPAAKLFRRRVNLL